MNKDHELYGQSIEPYRIGLACFNERKHFYESHEWKDLAKLRRMVDRQVCLRCHAKNVQLHVHHISPIQTMYSVKFYRNLSLDRLQTLCAQCHQLYHNETIWTPEFMHYMPANQTEVDDEKQYIVELSRAHDLAKECLFCKTFVWDK